LTDLGLSRKDVRKIIQSHMDKNADLIIGIDDPEMIQLIDVLCDAIAIAIEQNNIKIKRDQDDAARDAGFRLSGFSG